MIGQVDVVLLTHADVAHLGALPLLRRLGLTCPVYATVPVWRMGQLVLLDALHARTAAYRFDAFSAADVAAAFAGVHTLKYTQEVALTGRGAGITIVPEVAGHAVGGAFWRVTKGSEDVVYAVDFNHSGEQHLNPSDLQLVSTRARPTLLITNALNATVELPKRVDRRAQFQSLIVSALAAGGNVLLPTDAAGRVLELLSMLNAHWDQHKLHDTYPLVLLSHTGASMLDNIQSMTEWCSEAVTLHFNTKGTNAFAFRRLRVCTSLAQLDALIATHAEQSLLLSDKPRPMVVLAPAHDLTVSMGLELAQRCADSDIWKCWTFICISLCLGVVARFGILSFTLSS